MASRRDYYFRQKVTEAELDAGFNGLEQADFNIVIDHELMGIVTGLTVSEAAVPDLTVDVALGTAYSKQGERIRVSGTQNVDCSQDDSGTPTTVATPGNTKVVSVFIEFDRALSDPRIDGNSLTVYFQRDESYSFSVIQGAEALIGTEVPPPLDSGKILLADIRLVNGGTTITNAAVVGAYDQIDTTRREDAFKFTGGTVEIIEGTSYDATDAILTALNNHIDGSSNQHPADEVTYDDTVATWHDGTTLDGATVVDDVQEAIEAVLTDLASETSNGGGDKIGIAAQSSGGESVSAGSIYDQITEILTAIGLKAPLAGTNTFTGTSNTFTNTLNANSDFTVDGYMTLDDVLEFTNVADLSELLAALMTTTPPNYTVTNWARCLLFSFKGSYVASQMEFRIYGTSGSTTTGEESIEIAINCYWDGGTSGTWEQVDTNFSSILIRLAYRGIEYYHKDSGTGTGWTDSAWDETIFQVDRTTYSGSEKATLSLEDGSIRFRNTTAAATGAVSNPTQSVTPTANAIYAKNTCKAWAYFNINSSGVITTVEGFNVQTPSNPTSSPDFDFDFRTTLDDSNYAVVCCDMSGLNLNWIVINEAVGGFTIRLYDADAGTTIDHDSVGAAHQVGVIVFGTDTSS